MKTPVLLHQIGDRKHGSNFNTLEEILACDAPLTFDGVYESVYQNYTHLKGRQVTLFVMGKYIGGDNSFDEGQPLSRYCNLAQIVEIARKLNATIGYHGWAHRRCVGLDEAELIAELSPPSWMKVLGNAAPILAWPYGDYDERAIDVAEKLGYVEAWSVTQGEDGPFSRKRALLNW